MQLTSLNNFTPEYRAGTGPPLVLIHGFTDTWRTWELVLPALERHHDVLAPTLPGHAGGPALPGEFTETLLADEVERTMDEAGFETAHVVGNSLGGYVALQLAARGRARTVVALAPAGGWAAHDDSYKLTLSHFGAMQALLRAALPFADALVSTMDGRRRATQLITSNFDHIPPALIIHMMRGVATCSAVGVMSAYALEHGWPLDPQSIDCPVRIVWGTEDQLLAWPGAAARYLSDWLPHADWVELPGVGHCPQLDVPTETAQLILGFTAR